MSTCQLRETPLFDSEMVKNYWITSMNDYFKTFQNITQSVEQMTAEPSSIELKQSATRLKDSVRPCVVELSQSAAKLKGLVQVCFDDLHSAEDVWNSKPRIAQAPTYEIWEEIGQVSGRDVKVRHLGQLKSQTIEQAKKAWKKRVYILKATWFIDVKTGKSKDVAAWDKDKLIQDIRLNLDLQAKDIKFILDNSLKILHQEIEAIIDTVRYYSSFLDQETRTNRINMINLIKTKIKPKADEQSYHSQDNINKYTLEVNIALENLIKQGFLGINKEQFSNFSNQVDFTLEKIIVSVFDERVELVNKASAQVIAFYNDFLERQERYQQETPEQREAEKTWLAQKRRELEHVQYGIEAILNQSVG